MSDQERSQFDIAASLQKLWLERMEHLLRTGDITSTDLATLARVLLANGWTIDPSRLPKGLAEKLTKTASFENVDPEEIERRLNGED